MDLFEEACLLPITAIFHQESQMEINVTANGWLSFISFHINITSCKFQSKCNRKFSILLSCFFFFQETILLFQKKIIFISPTTSRMKKKGQRQGRGLTVTMWEVFTLVIDLKPDKRG